MNSTSYHFPHGYEYVSTVPGKHMEKSNIRCSLKRSHVLFKLGVWLCTIVWIISLLSKNILGSVYISLEYTKYSSVESFTEIDELLTFCGTTQNVGIIGDFNSRISNATDYIAMDESLVNNLDTLNDNDDNMFA